MKTLFVVILILLGLILLSRALPSVRATPATETSAETAALSAQTKSSNYGKRYSMAILRGVKLSDVFTFNDTDTTSYGPAYANVWTSPSNFLKCTPPTGSEFSYALCYYSGPDQPTGNNSENPSLPCKLSPDGVVANCSCYKITTDGVSPKVPYYVDINAISNLDIYQETVETCGIDGGKCAVSDRDPLVCEAINANLLVPGADLISVFSPLYKGNYSDQGGDNSTSCVDGDAGIYAGCMTAPCYDTGEQDANGNDIVECKCPVFDGPFQIGQGNQSCNANDPPPSAATSSSQDGSNSKSRIDNNVWSAAFNPSGGSIEPPAGACVPDLPGEKGCGLFDPEMDYASIIDPNGKLCQNVCDAYGGSVTDSNPFQVGYTCDATLCTTIGIGQEGNPPPIGDQASLLGQACNGIQEIDGMKQILLVETLAECSCCASQVCGCDNIDGPTNNEILNLNQEQRDVGINPQCDINGTLCGETP
jgi:hypothetical protein